MFSQSWQQPSTMIVNEVICKNLSWNYHTVNRPSKHYKVFQLHESIVKVMHILYFYLTPHWD